jgi:hypothetical protein
MTIKHHLTGEILTENMLPHGNIRDDYRLKRDLCSRAVTIQI